MDGILGEIKTVLSDVEGVLEGSMIAETSEAVNRILGKAMSAGSSASRQAWLATAETDAEIIEMDDVIYHYKLER